jgi:hypothetical protein
MTSEEEKDFYEYVNKMKGELPPPSEWPGDIVIPHGIYGYDHELAVPQYGKITFTKDIHDGIVIGWKLKEDK